MRGISKGSDSGNFAARVMYEASPKRSSRATPTGKFISAIHTAFDSLSFDAEDWAFTFSLGSVAIQRRFVNALVAYFAVLSEKESKSMWRDEEERMLLQDGATIYRSLNFLDN